MLPFKNLSYILNQNEISTHALLFCMAEESIKQTL